MNHRVWVFIGAVFLLFTAPNAASAEPKRVLLLNSFGRDFSPWAEFAKSFRADLDRTSSEPIEFHDVSLETERFGADQEEGPFADYLLALFAKRRLDLIVAIGAPAARFVQRYRSQLFPSTPMLLTAIEQRRVPLASLGANDAVVATSNDFNSVIENILQVLPDTTDVAVVIGNSPIEQFWLEQIRSAVQPYTKRVAFTWFNDLPFDEMLKRAATLPPKSAIFFFLLSVDAAGISHEEAKSFVKLRAAANAPIFSYIDTNFGHGIAGGPLILADDVAQQAASVARRILSGEVASAIKTPPVGPGAPKFDWRELERWNISERQLPPGSEISFRPPSMWELYRLQVAGGVIILIFQSGLIAWLLIEQRRRYSAELEAGKRRREVIHLNRTATATVLSASIAHELNQPLAAILSNAEAAEILLKTAPLDLNQIGEILADIRKDDQRAGDIIHHLRNLLKKGDDAALQIVDLNDTVQEVVSIAAAEAMKRGVRLRTVQTPEALPVKGDHIHLQQVILNLVMNGIDALESCDPRTRSVTIQTSRISNSDAEVTVIDSGQGIPEKNLKNVFETFFTTKPQGTGLGLPIARTIIEGYGGTLRAENRNGGGAIFRFTLSLA